MQLRINQKLARCIAPVVAACLTGVLGAAEGPVAAKPTDAQLEAMAKASFIGPPEPQIKHPKIGSALLEIGEIARVQGAWRAAAATRGLLVEDGSVLVEIRLDPDSARAAAWKVENLGGRIRHHSVPSLMEVWLPIDAIEKTADLTDVHLIRPARLVQPTVGNATSEGVAALNVNTGTVDFDYHDLGADGSGITIANIDAGYSGYAALQASGDWPQPANLRRFEVDGGSPVDCDVSTCSNYEASVHGAATMEIAFDVAPAADYMTYRTTTVGDWYTALVDAANEGADVVTVSLSAPLDNVGDGSVCPPNSPAPCGTIAEAAAYARLQGTLVVVSAGNNRLIHWGGAYRNRRGYHGWSGRETYNRGGTGGGLYCYPNGYPLGVDLFWDDWTDVDHDYDLLLYEYDGSNWDYVAGSFYWQSGGAGQTPQEAIRYTVTGAQGAGGCDPGYGMFAIRVQRYDASTARNLQVFAGNWGGLEYSTPDHSLGFPADSPNVFAAGAVEVTSPSTLEDYSAEGPVLGPGGSQATPSPANPKPDGVSVSGVSTVSYGASGFGGTSSAAPHTTGIAAILTQLHNEKYATPPATNNPDGIHSLLSTFALEDPTFPAVFDTTYGNGLVKLRFCDQTVSVAADEWIMLGLPCVRRDSSTVADVLGDDLDLVGGTWEVWQQGQTLGSYVQLFENDLLKPGVGFWLVYDDDATVDIQGLVQDRSEAYPFQLHGEDSEFGWANFLGHPFTTDVDWPDVKVFYAGAEHSLADAIADGVMRNFLWKPYTATGYVENDGLLGEGTLNTFDGFWVKAFQDAELRIPTSLAAEHADHPGRDATAAGWSVDLQASARGVSAKARIGHLPDSRRGWDLHDAEHMPSFEAHQLAVVMPHPDWDTRAGNYVRDFQSPRPSSAWKFEVRSNQGGLVELRWKGPRSILERSMVIDRQTGATINALKLVEEGYRFKMAPGVREFLWRVR